MKLLLATCALLFVWGCEPTTYQKLRITYTDPISSTLLLVAQEKGFFRKEGLDVELQPQDTSFDSLAGLGSGDSDLAQAFNTTLVLRKGQRPENFRVINELYSASKNRALVCRKSEQLKALVDLRGKKLVMGADASSEWFLHLFGITEGILPHQMKVMTLPFNEVVKALESGAADCAILHNPYLEESLAALGRGHSLVFYSSVFSEVGVMVTTPKLLSDRRSALRGFLKALLLAETWSSTHAKSLPEVLAKFVTVKDSHFLEKSLKQSVAQVRLSNTFHMLYETQSQWVRSRPDQNQEALPDFYQMIDVSLLSELRPQSVTVEMGR